VEAAKNGDSLKWMEQELAPATIRAARIGVRVRSGCKPHMASLIEMRDSQEKMTARNGVIMFLREAKKG
jgi:hypothetical protein